MQCYETSTASSRSSSRSSSDSSQSPSLDARRPRTFSNYFEDLKRNELLRPQPGDTHDEAEEELFADLDEHDELNQQMMTTYRTFRRQDGKLHDWHDIPQAELPGKVVFMFLVVDRLKNEHWWREWFDKADSGGHKHDYSIVYHRGCAYGKQGDTISGDLLAEKGVAVLPATKTGWARNGLVRACILLMRFGLENPNNQWFVLLSDTCMPLYSFRDLIQHIRQEDESRFNDFGMTLDITMRRHIWQPGACGTSRRSHKADQWAMWIREDAEWFVRENHLLRLKPRSVFVDEPYFINMMDEHDRPYKVAKTTYSQWYHRSDLPGLTAQNTMADVKKLVSSPHTFEDVDMETIHIARTMGCWFMRKVAAGAPYPSAQELDGPVIEIEDRAYGLGADRKSVV